jgi:hypothetical protein
VGERREAYSPDSPLGRHVAEHDAQWVSRLKLVVAVGDDHQRRDCLQAAGEQAHNIQRRLVGPMCVLEDEDGRQVCAQLCPQRPDDFVGRRATDHKRLEPAPNALGDIEQGPERPRCEQRLACAPQHACPGSAVVAEPAQQRRLAHARVARYQYEPPRRTWSHRVQGRAQHLELFRPFEQLIGAGVHPHAACPHGRDGIGDR